MYTENNLPEMENEEGQEQFNDPLNEQFYADRNTEEGKTVLSFLLPVFLVIYFIAGFAFTGLSNENDHSDNNSVTGHSDHSEGVNLLSSQELTSPVKDTVYTDKDSWLELRIHEQYVYQHWRDGRVLKFPISSGNKFISKGIESRPGLFAIFYRNPHHKSTQFDDASLYHFQTFNQGIGFHSLSGTGYYSLLGVRPASHGCIRMRHEDAKKLFEDCSMGTLVLAHNGYSSRVVAFAPKDVEKPSYTKEEMKIMLARNLKNVMDGNYYNADRKFFVVDPSAIPMSGVYISYDKNVPKKQKLPVNLFTFEAVKDRLVSNIDQPIMDSETAERLFAVSKNVETPKEEVVAVQNTYDNDADLVKKYFHNPIGILPYFPPTKKAPTYSNYSVSSTTGTSTSTGTGE